MDAHKKLLWRDGEPVALAPKVLETLLVLIELRDRVVTKDELLERVWDGAAVEEGGLTRNISILRKALGEKPDDHTYIVTVPGKGYRFVADVRESAGPLSPARTSPAREGREQSLHQRARPVAVAPVRWIGGARGTSCCIPFASQAGLKRDNRRFIRSRCCRWTICRATPRRNTSPTA